MMSIWPRSSRLIPEEAAYAWATEDKVGGFGSSGWFN
jgi:hypothetical protein